MASQSEMELEASGDGVEGVNSNVSYSDASAAESVQLQRTADRTTMAILHHVADDLEIEILQSHLGTEIAQRAPAVEESTTVVPAPETQAEVEQAAPTAAAPDAKTEAEQREWEKQTMAQIKSPTSAEGGEKSPKMSDEDQQGPPYAFKKGRFYTNENEESILFPDKSPRSGKFSARDEVQPRVDHMFEPDPDSPRTLHQGGVESVPGRPPLAAAVDPDPHAAAASSRAADEQGAVVDVEGREGPLGLSQTSEASAGAPGAAHSTHSAPGCGGLSASAASSANKKDEAAPVEAERTSSGASLAPRVNFAPSSQALELEKKKRLSLSVLGKDLEVDIMTNSQESVQRQAHKDIAARHKNVKSKITVLSPELYENKNCKAGLVLRKHTVQAVTDFFSHLYEPIGEDVGNWKTLGKSYEDRVAEKRVLMYLRAKTKLERRQRLEDQSLIPKGVSPERWGAYLERKQKDREAIANRATETHEFDAAAKRRDEVRRRREAYSWIAEELVEATELRSQLLARNTATRRFHLDRPDSPLNQNKHSSSSSSQVAKQPAAVKRLKGATSSTSAAGAEPSDSSPTNLFATPQAPSPEKLAELSTPKRLRNHQRSYLTELPKIYESAEQKLEQLSEQLDKRLHKCLLRVQKVSPGKRLAPMKKIRDISSTEEMVGRYDVMMSASPVMMRGNFSAPHPVYDPSNFNGGTRRDAGGRAGGGQKAIELLT